MTLQTQTRTPGLDLLRVLACYMVLQVHAGEFYYIADGGTVAAGAAPYMVNWLNSLCRTAVPLFVMLSGYFLLPVQGPMTTFFSRRFVRVGIPFIVWCVLYALYGLLRGQGDVGTMLINICHIPVNYGVEVGHLWYVYMLMGLYLFAPILSPWLQTASRRGVEFYLVLWALTLCIPYIHLIYPKLLGEACWNGTPMFYYFSGFLGYMVLAFYLRRYCAEPRRWHIPLGVALIAVGYVVTALGFRAMLPTAQNVCALELPWGFETLNVAMMSLGLFLLLRGIRSLGRATTIVTDISKLSYGIYLVHIMLLNFFYALLDPLIASVAVRIPVIALCTFVTSYGVIKLVSLLPKSKYIIG
ncbi:MAG: acyltransferase family protein [Alistipes sp.]